MEINKNIGITIDNDIAALFGLSTENTYLQSMIENQLRHYIINRRLGISEKFRVDENLARLSGYDVGQICKYNTGLRT